jgi:hypothetical protein
MTRENRIANARAEMAAARDAVRVAEAALAIVGRVGASAGIRRARGAGRRSGGS